MRGIRRDWGQPPAKKVAAVDDDIKKMADAMDPVTGEGPARSRPTARCRP